MKSALCFVLFLICFFLSCEKENPPPATCHLEQELWPLKVGNRWTYLSSFFTLTDTVVLGITGTFPLIIEGDTIIASKFSLISVNGDPNPDSNAATLYWNGPQGVYLCGSLAGEDTLIAQFFNPEFRCNVDSGDTWKVQRPVYSEQYPYNLMFEKQTYTLLSTNEEIATPAGIFNCYVYQYTRADPTGGEEPPYYFDYTYYISPGKGLVGFL